MSIQTISLRNLTLTVFALGYLQPLPCVALPPTEDIPEEVLRTEIILEGRSPIDGEPLSAGEYEQLQAKLKESAFDPEIDSDIQQLIILLQIRKLFKTIIPFY